MDKEIGILHLSDIHAHSESKVTISRLTKLLIEDLERIQSEYNTHIGTVCISGDLINSGDNAESELDIVLTELIQPIMNALKLDEKSFFIVPGNHEVKRTNIMPYVESGLASTLTSEIAIEDFMRNIDSGSINRIAYFNDFVALFGETPLLKTPLMQSYSLQCGNTTIGIVCVNSAWRSTGVGSAEKRKMIIGRKQIIDGFESIQTADIKLCIMHHPLDWLVDEDKIAIEKCISGFDIVLNGHIHETDTKVYTTYNGQTIFHTCGKFDNSSDIYNGYAVVSINPYNKECSIILRQYFDYPRNCFDKAISLQKDGVFRFKMGAKNDALALAYNVVRSISENFLNYANSYFVSNVASGGKILKNFDESFIPPVLSKYSEYEKETIFDDKDESAPSLDEICNGMDNILLLGKKEIGKTTLLHYISKYSMSNFNVLHRVPLIIDCLHIDFAGKNTIARAAFQFVNEFCSDDDSYSQTNINILLENGFCTVLFDNFETVGAKELVKINEFLAKYPKNKFIFSEKESVSARALRAVPVTPECKYKEIHICSLTKMQIRAIAKQCVLPQDPNPDTSSVIDKVMLCFKKTTLPKTPFVLSLILSLCDNSDFAPINEAVVMELFMESLLEKASPGEADSRTFDFRNKEDFLIFLVSYMSEKNRYYLTSEEFETLLKDYHSDIGFSISETGFDRLFFDKGVLVRTELLVTFRYTCMVEYYIAKKAGQEPEFLANIMSNRNYLNYSNELIYYTGLNRKNGDILHALQDDLCRDCAQLQPVISELNSYNIGLDISMPEDFFSKKLSESRLTQNESDNLSDAPDSSEEILPETIDKKIEHGDMNAFIETLLIYGSCLKNLELISKAEKTSAFENYLSGLCIMLAILKKQTEKYWNEILSEMESKPGEFAVERLKKAENAARDIIKIALPLSVENIALENVGTAKLKAILESNIQIEGSDAFKKFFSVFLFADLRLPGLQNILGQYAKEAKDKSLLKIIFFKFLYYYQFRYFSSSLDSFLENTLADINIKLQNSNKFKKEQLISNIKKMDRTLSG